MEPGRTCPGCNDIFNSAEDLQFHLSYCEKLGECTSAGQSVSEIGSLQLTHTNSDGVEQDLTLSGESVLPEQDEISMNVKNVSYTLNKQRAFSKIVKACNREVYDLEWNNKSCTITFSTAAFDMFRQEVVPYLKGIPRYQLQKDVMKDQAQNIPQDIIRVREKQEGKVFEDLSRLFTINLYRTVARVMVLSLIHI